MHTYEIYVKNVYSQLSGCTPELENLLSVAHDNYWFSRKYRLGLWDGRTHFLKTPSLKFPTGLLFLVQDYFVQQGLEYIIHDNRPNPVTPEASGKMLGQLRPDLLHGIALRDYQLEAIEAALMKIRGALELPTGSGKTEIAAGILKLLDLPALFLVHTQTLLWQTVKRFEARLQTPIGYLGDNEVNLEPAIVVATIQSLNSIFENHQADAKALLSSFPVLFQDEVHHASAATWYRLGMYCHNAYFRFGLSGTILRRDVLSNMKMLAVFGAPIYRKQTMGLVDAGYLSDIELKMLQNPEVVQGRKWQEIYEDGVVRSASRNGQIAEIAAQAFRAGKRVMILVRKLAHGTTLRRMLVNTHHVPAEFLCGQTPSALRQQCVGRFEQGEFVLIASPIFDEGVDIPSINVLIIAAGGLSEVKTIQRVGRGLRKKANDDKLVVYDFQDSSRFLKKHSSKRLAIYKKEGFVRDDGRADSQHPIRPSEGNL